MSNIGLGLEPVSAVTLLPLQPPCSEAWYTKFYKDHTASLIRYDGPGSRRLALGLGLTQHQETLIVARARALLPQGRSLDMKLAEGIAHRQIIAQQLMTSADVGPLLQPKFSATHILAAKFFAEAAGRWVMVGNWHNKEMLKKAVKRMVGAPQLLHDSNAAAPDVAQVAHYTRSQRPQSTPQETEHALYGEQPLLSGSHEVAAEDAVFLDLERYSPAAIETTSQDTAVAGSSSSEHTGVSISEDEDVNQEEQDDTSANSARQTAPQQSSLLLANRLELHSVKRQPMTIFAFMDDMFGTDGTPHVSRVFLHPIVSYWNDYLRLCGLPIDDSVYPQFRYSSPGGELDGYELLISNDVNLRIAYRVWLSRGDINTPFVLFVDDV